MPDEVTPRTFLEAYLPSSSIENEPDFYLTRPFVPGSKYDDGSATLHVVTGRLTSLVSIASRESMIRLGHFLLRYANDEMTGE